jgi:zinc transport system substrate-binding protein
MFNLERKLFIILIIFSILFFILSFFNFDKYLRDTHSKIKILVTNGALYDFLKNIGGDKIEIIKPSFLNQSGHIHDIELLPQDVIKIKSADVILKIGYGLDDWLNDKITDDKVKIFQLDKGVKLIKENNQINPHYWLSIKNAQIIVNNINNILSQLDPQNSFYYHKKTNDYLLKLKELENYALENLKELKDKKVIITHPSFNYLFNDYQIKVAFTLYSDELKELTAKEILELAQIIKKEKISIIFVEKGFLTNFVNQIIKIYNLKPVFLNPLEVIEDNESYYGLMRENIYLIKNNLK